MFSHKKSLSRGKDFFAFYGTCIFTKNFIMFDIASQICTALPYGVCQTPVALAANCTKKFDTVHKICVKIPKVDFFQKQIW